MMRLVGGVVCAAGCLVTGAVGVSLDEVMDSVALVQTGAVGPHHHAHKGLFGLSRHKRYGKMKMAEEEESDDDGGDIDDPEVVDQEQADKDSSRRRRGLAVKNSPESLPQLMALNAETVSTNKAEETATQSVVEQDEPVVEHHHHHQHHSHDSEEDASETTIVHHHGHHHHGHPQPHVHLHDVASNSSKDLDKLGSIIYEKIQNFSHSDSFHSKVDKVKGMATQATHSLVHFIKDLKVLADSRQDLEAIAPTQLEQQGQSAEVAQEDEKEHA